MSAEDIDDAIEALETAKRVLTAPNDPSHVAFAISQFDRATHMIKEAKRKASARRLAWNKLYAARFRKGIIAPVDPPP